MGYGKVFEINLNIEIFGDGILNECVISHDNSTGEHYFLDHLSLANCIRDYVENHFYEDEMYRQLYFEGKINGTVA